MRTCTVVWLLLCCLCLQAQQQNLVPNPGFESIVGQPERWFYTGSDFNLVFNDWKSPTAASPDVYHESIPVPAYWQEKGFYKLRPFSGKAMVGLTLYGCNQGKLHCREYISIPLRDSLVIGQEYLLSLWLAPMKAGIPVNHLHAAFDREISHAMDDRLLELKPIYELQVDNDKTWQSLEIRFYAETEARFLTLGNFKDDANTQTGQVTAENDQPFGYYYLDEISLKKIPPILDREPIETYDARDWSAGTSVAIDNIYFDFDQSNLLPASYQELNKLLLLLHQNPSMKIRICGHTDQVGSAAYNQSLSLRRAQAVAEFLTRHYIEAGRLQVKGFSFDQPIASNEDEVGRQKNRRVVFEILK